MGDAMRGKDPMSPLAINVLLWLSWQWCGYMRAANGGD